MDSGFYLMKGMLVHVDGDDGYICSVAEGPFIKYFDKKKDSLKLVILDRDLEAKNDQQIALQANRPSQHSEDSELHGPPLPKSECDPGYEREDYHWEGGYNIFRGPNLHPRVPSQDREDNSRRDAQETRGEDLGPDDRR